MYRHSGVAFQLRTLRRAVKQPRWGFNRSAARTHRKPSPNLDEENFTRRLPEARKGRPKRERAMSSVLVIGQDKRPRAPVHPGRARQFLANGQAAVYRRYPFVLILTRPQPEAPPQPLRLKIDPGSKTTGLAVVNDASGPRTSPIGESRCALACSPGGGRAAVVASGTPGIGSRAFAIAAAQGAGWPPPY
jgi:hypothetical protein